ncbi:hypothetical protein PDL09_24270 [Bacillus cereus]|nr:hypothetical protein [Bacillus cereus]
MIIYHPHTGDPLIISAAKKRSDCFMAKRPTKAQQKRDIDKMYKDLCDLKLIVKRHDEEIKNSQRREIIRMLQERTHHKSERYKFTYMEIAEEIGCSYTTIANIAREERLNRRLNVVE